MYQPERSAPERVRDHERCLGNDGQAVELGSTEEVAGRRRSGIYAVVELGHDGRGTHRASSRSSCRHSAFPSSVVKRNSSSGASISPRANARILPSSMPRPKRSPPTSN